ncbi:ABC transporter substrate-binding protein [Trujillonella endophytica]|uniref:Amino acid/amide ABC transporter substrate-binding protein, HAAT family (TC 3.A.1.4.-) n=1 Tax=Trujillonella endophytica TaxID=673521 RepID=A0A1H8URB3_9ACTN|nr:ABC transporter substrate-binding protein [Trujillella endophytica]SEP05701.1 amino acid/amide ABC transporter substrate-binding protein, HAAT family (TC 3.A.1.4.-) [Trujillella endophytica]
MRTRTRTAVGATCALLLALTACGSDDEEGGGGGTTAGGEGGGGTVKIGVVTPLSGPAAATYGDAAGNGVEARLAAYEEEGGECSDIDFEVVEADDASNPAGSLAAAQRLVQQEEVYAILSSSQAFYGATAFMLTQPGVPVLGDGTDPSPEWRATGNNLFLSQPVPDITTAYPMVGDFLAAVGGTTMAGVAFSVPASQQALQAAADSAEAAGLDIGYLNDNVQFGSTDVGPIVLGIRDTGADALYLPITFDTALAVVEGLRQNDIEVAGVLAATGYGADLLENPVAVEAAQGVSFSIAYAPVSLGTEATERLRNAVIDQGVESGIPGYAMSSGWFNADLFLHGLELAGCDATQQEFIDELNQDDTWDASGLYGEPIDFTVEDQPQLCQYFVTLEGEEFVAVEGASPACGAPLD